MALAFSFRTKKTMNSGWIVEVRQISDSTLHRIRERYAADSREAREWSRAHDYSPLTHLIETAEGSVPLPARGGR